MLQLPFPSVRQIKGRLKILDIILSNEKTRIYAYKIKVVIDHLMYGIQQYTLAIHYSIQQDTCNEMGLIVYTNYDRSNINFSRNRVLNVDINLRIESICLRSIRNELNTMGAAHKNQLRPNVLFSRDE